MQKITPFLWFDHQAENAVKFYTAIFKNTKMGRILRYGEEAPKAGGPESQCGWLKDKFGVSWQVVPTVLIDMLHDKDPGNPSA